MNAVAKVDFHGQEIDCIKDDAGVWVLHRRLCENIGLDAKSQRDKLQGKGWATGVMITSVAEDGKMREQWMLHIDAVPMWLATIDVERVAEHARPKIELYQKECATVLRNHFFGSQGASGMLKLDEVHRRTGYSPSSLRTRRCRGHYLPFPLHLGDDGCLRVDSRDIDAWVERVKSGDAAKARVVAPKREVLPRDVTQREAPPALATPRNNVERLLSKAQMADAQVRNAQAAQQDVAKELEVEVRRLLPSVIEMLKAMPKMDHRLVHALNAAAAGKPLQY